MDSESLLNTNEINIVRGKYHIDDVCRKIVNNYRDMDELFGVMDLSEVVRRFLRLKEIMPRVEQFYGKIIGEARKFYSQKKSKKNITQVHVEIKIKNFY